MKNIFIIGLLGYIILTTSCARIGTITGGDKDTIPPRLVRSKPLNYTINFKDKKLRLDFDEYIQLKDPNQQINVSPPMKKKPKITLNSKSIYISYADTLRDSTTYTISFGNAIVDNNEGNILSNFEFVFSTGPFIDSMAIQGQVINSLTLLPDKDPMLVMLYENLADSAPYTVKPTFTSRTDKNGYYFINNVKEGIYRLYALKDGNYNYKYDPPQENFAFVDTLIILNSELIKQYVPKQHNPIRVITTKKIKKEEQKNNVVKREIIKHRRNEDHALYADLKYFKEDDKKQYVKDYKRKIRRRFDVVFNIPLFNDSVSIVPIYKETQNWYEKEFSITHDTVYFWVTDSNVYKLDTMTAVIQYPGNDKHFKKKISRDTVNFRYVERKSKKKTEKFNDELTLNIQNNGYCDLNGNISITSAHPISKIETDSIELYKINDSIETLETYLIQPDSFNNRTIYIKKRWEEKTKYALYIMPRAINDIYGLGNDTVILNFNTPKLEDYGKVIVNITGVKQNVLVQLLNGENVAYQKATQKDAKLVFDYMKPQKYTVRIVYDDNKNNKWDTGDFSIKKQPENVYYLNDELNVRANWEVNLPIKLP